MNITRRGSYPIGRRTHAGSESRNRNRPGIQSDVRNPKAESRFRSEIRRAMSRRDGLTQAGGSRVSHG
eukprot:1001219-Prorocentrum_minimum.AAC.1